MTSPLTIDEARAVLWPFATPRRPIGDLLDAGRIGEPDLAARRARGLQPPREIGLLGAVVDQATTRHTDRGEADRACRLSSDLPDLR